MICAYLRGRKQHNSQSSSGQDTDYNKQQRIGQCCVQGSNDRSFSSPSCCGQQKALNHSGPCHMATCPLIFMVAGNTPAFFLVGVVGNYALPNVYPKANSKYVRND